MSARDPCIEDLPVHLMVEIFSRLPVKTIIKCKCVCKKWLNIVLDPYFADTRLSRSTTGFMIYHKPSILKWVEVEDELNHHNVQHDTVMSLDLKLVANLEEAPLFPVVSVNGLVCMWQVSRSIDKTYICNPITREYMNLPKQKYCIDMYTVLVVYCFGVGSLTRNYKVIRILQKHSTHAMSQLAEGYTLGTGQWRSLGHVPYLLSGSYGLFLNGHAHWIIGDQDSRDKICSFNFDNETFELFPSPPSEATEEGHIYSRWLGVLKGCLCRCDSYTSKLIIIWVMKEYGIKKSWHKELVIRESITPNVDMQVLHTARPVEDYKDGTILMASSGNSLIVYCPRKEAIVETTKIFYGPYGSGIAYRPSFHRLPNFENERVHMF